MRFTLSCVRVAPAINISGCAAENPARRQTATFYILCLRDFEILGARDLKRDEGERVIFLAAYSASGLFTFVDGGSFSAKSFN
jgi:hypothetical protein